MDAGEPERVVVRPLLMNVWRIAVPFPATFHPEAIFKDTDDVSDG